jgi:hypothetical protein
MKIFKIYSIIFLYTLYILLFYYQIVIFYSTFSIFKNSVKKNTLIITFHQIEVIIQSH